MIRASFNKSYPERKIEISTTRERPLGKRFQDSKVEYVYDFYVHSQKHEITVVRSFLTDTIRVNVDGKLVYCNKQDKKNQERDSFRYEHSEKNFRFVVTLEGQLKFNVEVFETGPASPSQVSSNGVPVKQSTYQQVAEPYSQIKKPVSSNYLNAFGGVNFEQGQGRPKSPVAYLNIQQPYQMSAQAIESPLKDYRRASVGGQAAQMLFPQRQPLQNSDSSDKQYSHISTVSTPTSQHNRLREPGTRPSGFILPYNNMPTVLEQAEARDRSPALNARDQYLNQGTGSPTKQNPLRASLNIQARPLIQTEMRHNMNQLNGLNLLESPSKAPRYELSPNQGDYHRIPQQVGSPQQQWQGPNTPLYQHRGLSKSEGFAMSTGNIFVPSTFPNQNYNEQIMQKQQFAPQSPSMNQPSMTQNLQKQRSTPASQPGKPLTDSDIILSEADIKFLRTGF